jgi:hypothetical protein
LKISGKWKIILENFWKMENNMGKFLENDGKISRKWKIIWEN